MTDHTHSDATDDPDEQPSHVMTDGGSSRGELALDHSLTSAGFFEALSEDRLVGGRCQDCDAVLLPPRPICNECGGYASSLGLFDHDMGKEDVDFECPECGDVADKIAFERGMVNVWHYREPEPGASVLDGKDICRFNFEPMEEWRRGESKGSLEGHDD
jgi:hypothetical protein